MTEALTTPGDWRLAISSLVEDLGSSLRPGQREEILSALGAGEWRLSLEFLMDYIIDDQIIISSAIYTRIEALTQVLRPREGLTYVKELVLDMDE